MYVHVHVHVNKKHPSYCIHVHVHVDLQHVLSPQLIFVTTYTCTYNVHVYRCTCTYSPS